MKMQSVVICVALALCAVPAVARDNGQWDGNPAKIKYWFEHLMQPDQPAVSCCGESDAYYADSYETEGDQYVAIITDERPDGSRRHIDIGTRILIPKGKIKYDDGNPTGHGIVFLGSSNDNVYCFLAPGGV